MPNFESVWCELTSTKSSLVIGVCHHRTSASVVNEVALHNVIGQACRRYINVLISFLSHFIHHSFADDLQLQMSAPPDRISELLHSMQSCICDVKV